MVDQAGSGRATWFVIALVLLGVAIVTALSEHPGFASNGGARQQLVSVLSSSHQVSEPKPFAGADVTAVMGSCALDLRHAQLTRGEQATVDVFAMMGSVTIRAPEGWTIDTHAIPVLGGIRDDRWRRSAESDSTPADELPRLVLRGVVMMGSIFVKS